jgi:hypothetical protein
MSKFFTKDSPSTNRVGCDGVAIRVREDIPEGGTLQLDPCLSTSGEGSMSDVLINTLFGGASKEPLNALALYREQVEGVR